MRTTHILSLATLATLAWTSPASAATEPDPASIDKLRECVVQYTKEQFAEALVLCKESLSIQRNAATLLTVAKTYEKLGKCDLARDFADQSIAQEELALDERGREKADSFLERLPDSDYCAAPEEPTPEPTLERRRFGWMSYVGAGALVLGAGGAGAGMYFGSEAEREISELPDADSQASHDALTASIESNQSLGQALLLSGAGLAVVGVALVVVDAVTVEEVEVAPVVIAPVLGADRVGAAMFMRF